jgi:hypothetical protein
MFQIFSRAGVKADLRLSIRRILAFCRPTMPCGAGRRQGQRPLEKHDDANPQCKYQGER